MLLISLSSPLPKRWVWSLAACVVFAAISCLAQPVFFAVDSTPYDNQMARVSPVLLTSTNMQWPGPISSSFAVNQWMTELRAMPYRYSTYWQTPSEVNLVGAADCKGKAVALYAEMRRNGARNVRVVIGKRHISSSVTHAWLEWETKEGSYVLDPTFNEMPIKTAELNPMTYVPLYAYDGEHKYRAEDVSFVAPTARVAAGYGNHFYGSAGARSSFRQPGRIRAGSGQSFSATTEYATFSTGHPQPDAKRSWSDDRRSSNAVEGIRPAGVPAAAPNSEYIIQARPTPVSMQGRAMRNARHTTSNKARLRQVRSSVSSQNLENVMQTQARRQSSSL